MKRIVYIDASSLKSDSLCTRRYLLHIVRGYTIGLRAANYKAGYGTAFHSFLQYYYGVEPKLRGDIMGTLKTVGLQAYAKYEPHVDMSSVFEFRTSDHLGKVIDAYHARYQRGDSVTPLPFDIPAPKLSGHLLEGEIATPTEGKLLEQKFCLPWYEDDNLIIYLAGTIDLVADYHDKVIIVDHKSTSTPQRNIDQFFREFEMNIQTQFYVWIFRKLSGMKSYVPIMINGIFIKKPTIKVTEAGGFDGVHFQRSQLIEYTNEQMAQFEDWLLDKLSKLLAMLKLYDKDLETSNDPIELGPPEYAACQTRFGTCPFFELCALPPQEQLGFLRGRYKVEQYNPLAFND